MPTNKKVLIIGAVVLVAMIIGVIFLKSNQQGAPAEVKNEVATPVAVKPAAPATKQMTFTEIMSSSSAQKCTFQDNEEKNTIVGTLYVGSGKMHIDFATMADGQTTQGHMIMMKPTVYAWVDGSTLGIKSSLDEVKTPDSASQGIDLEKKLDFNCQPWTIDAASFTLPANVTFSSLSDMMPEVPGTNGSNATQCMACDKLNGDDKAQCRLAFKCK